VIHLTDELLNHPKLLRAGELIGRDGFARAFVLYVAGVSYSRKFLTDGVIPPSFFRQFIGVSNAQRVAAALADERVGLWHLDPLGYRIHDYLEWNANAQAIKEKRAATRERVAKWRAFQQRLLDGGTGHV
jgi:hypothetical protein